MMDPNDALAWLIIGIALFILGASIYSIYITVRRRAIPPPAAWARNLTDRQLWTIKGLIIAAGLLTCTVIILH